MYPKYYHFYIKQYKTYEWTFYIYPVFHTSQLLLAMTH